MRALTIGDGGRLVVDERPRPEPGPSDVVVGSRAPLVSRKFIVLPVFRVKPINVMTAPLDSIVSLHWAVIVIGPTVSAALK